MTQCGRDVYNWAEDEAIEMADYIQLIGQFLAISPGQSNWIWTAPTVKQIQMNKYNGP